VYSGVMAVGMSLRAAVGRSARSAYRDHRRRSNLLLWGDCFALRARNDIRFLQFLDERHALGDASPVHCHYIIAKLTRNDHAVLLFDLH